MANHKRRKPKSARSGCLWCKPWKDERSAPKTRRGVNFRQDWKREVAA